MRAGNDTGLREQLLREAAGKSTVTLSNLLREARQNLAASRQPHHAIAVEVYEAALAERNVTVVR